MTNKLPSWGVRTNDHHVKFTLLPREVAANDALREGEAPAEPRVV